MQAERLVKSLLSRALHRRGLLKTGAGLGTLGALAVATGCTTPLRGPGGVVVAPKPDSHLHPLAHGSTRAPGILRALPPDAPEPTWRARDPMEILTAFDYGRVSKLPNGQTLREYTLVAQETEIKVARGVTYPAWTYNGTVPGPTIRCTEGDRIKVYFHNASPHPHSIHLHGIHPANMDGVFEQIAPGGSYVYEFEAEPFGLFLYHCHTMPVKKHIEKGLYGTFIVDPKEPRPPAKELVMVMNGFDTDGDGENEFYTVNGVANYFVDNPIELNAGELLRVYLVNLTEFDLINSLHLHGNVFKLFRTGTSLTNYEITDTVMLCQGERCVLELTYTMPGKFMFHAHQSEFAELGWMGFFDVK
ncbi:MAG: multicopper oxidase domain-containing protein [Chloroflexi bacterium]|nr:multicopper oxidase domain-containing protein [Chloroflexota bacterium]